MSIEHDLRLVADALSDQRSKVPPTSETYVFLSDTSVTLHAIAMKLSFIARIISDQPR